MTDMNDTRYQIKESSPTHVLLEIYFMKKMPSEYFVWCHVESYGRGTVVKYCSENRLYHAKHARVQQHLEGICPAALVCRSL